MQVLLWMWHGSTWSLPLPKHKTCTAGLGPCSEACNVQWCDENCAAKYGQGTCSELDLYRFCVCTFICRSFSSERIDNYWKSEIKSSSFYLFLLFDLHVIDSSLVVTRTSSKFQCSYSNSRDKVSIENFHSSSTKTNRINFLKQLPILNNAGKFLHIYHSVSFHLFPISIYEHGVYVYEYKYTREKS